MKQLNDLNDYVKKHELTVYKWFTFILLIMMIGSSCYEIYKVTLYSGKPQIALYKEVLWTNDTTQTIGLYHHENHIDVSIQSGDIGKTFVHEYGHYLYYKVLTKEERRYFDEELCPEYYDGYKCEEQFAELFAVNIIYKFEQDTEPNRFINQIKEEYLE